MHSAFILCCFFKTIPLWRLIYEMIQFDKQGFPDKNFDQLPKSIEFIRI